MGLFDDTPTSDDSMGAMKRRANPTPSPSPTSLAPYNQGKDYAQKSFLDKVGDAINGVDPYTNKPKK